MPPGLPPTVIVLILMTQELPAVIRQLINFGINNNDLFAIYRFTVKHFWQSWKYFILLIVKESNSLLIYV